ncbi:hypothetical protein BVRB_9g210740 isoform B [Beta vulgaris subsp. vulgaris]|nr:hypothetical protein BVRB_9g210740 isoform B [Beta vulgaris subsp. vulgaris]
MDDHIKRASMIVALEELRRSLEPSESSESSTRQPRREMGEVVLNIFLDC